MCAAYTLSVVEGVFNSTLWAVRGQVELGNEVRDGES